MDVSTTTTFWNDDNFGADIPGQTRRLDEGTAFDSYITMNSSTGTAGGAAGSVALPLGRCAADRGYEWKPHSVHRLPWLHRR